LEFSRLITGRSVRVESCRRERRSNYFTRLPGVAAGGVRTEAQTGLKLEHGQLLRHVLPSRFLRPNVGASQLRTGCFGDITVTKSWKQAINANWTKLHTLYIVAMCSILRGQEMASRDEKFCPSPLYINKQERASSSQRQTFLTLVPVDPVPVTHESIHVDFHVGNLTSWEYRVQFSYHNRLWSSLRNFEWPARPVVPALRVSLDTIGACWFLDCATSWTTLYYFFAI